MFSLKSLAPLLFFGVAVQAHFRLNYPQPRGPYVSSNLPAFCGGYANVTENRTSYPISGGYFNIRNGHGDWHVGVTISTASNPNTFESFQYPDGSEQLVKPYAHEANAGTFCVPLDISAAGVPGVEVGANVTIQVVVLGHGDPPFYQCADLTLVDGPPIVDCVNATSIA